MNTKSHNNMNSKQSYSAPEAEVLVVKFEENILSNPNGLEDGTGVSFGEPNRNDYHG